MRVAFKEWAIVVDALGRGEQILILRKGGIAEGPGGFQPEHPSFLLFPTQFHQQREAVLPAAQARHDALAPSWPPPDRLRFEFHGVIAAWKRLDSVAEAEKLRGQHLWRDEVIADRFDWGRQKNIFALAVRVYRLPQPADLPMLPSYGGCKSWTEVEQDVPTDILGPVLSEADFGRKLASFNQALAG